MLRVTCEDKKTGPDGKKFQCACAPFQWNEQHMTKSTLQQLIRQWDREGFGRCADNDTTHTLAKSTRGISEDNPGLSMPFDNLQRKLLRLENVEERPDHH